MIIKNKTVFILGAGASAPYNYPTGKKLKNIICNKIHARNIAKLLSSTEDEINDIEQGILKFQQDFHKSAENSIDLFLKYNPELKNLGKQLIAAAILPIEDENSLFSQDKDDKWYLSFWNMIDHSFENIDKHDIHFITFNYDRSLEHFLITALYHLYSGKKTIEECAKKINSIDIIHVYGCLAYLPWQSKEGSRAYMPSAIKKQDLDNATQNLFIIGEERKNDEQSSKLEEIRSLMSVANYIYFFGFAYDEENLNLLGDNFSKVHHIWGTRLDLGDVATDKAKKIIRNKTPTISLNYNLNGEETERLQLINADVAEFLKENIHLA